MGVTVMLHRYRSADDRISVVARYCHVDEVGVYGMCACVSCKDGGVETLMRFLSDSDESYRSMATFNLREE